MQYLGCEINFKHPKSAPSLLNSDSISWRIFSNPVALAVGGITAVILELAEPRIRHGVWDHTQFRKKPLTRMVQTAKAAMITVYAPADQARKVIAKINLMHGRVRGVTPCGQAYAASDPDLLNWVQLTASFGFIEAYSTFTSPLSEAEKSIAYHEGRASARLYGATGSPSSLAACDEMFATWAPRLGPSPILHDFLEIVRPALIAPWPVSRAIIRCAVGLLPEHLITRLELTSHLPNRIDRILIKALAKSVGRAPIPFSPPLQARARMRGTL